LSSDFIACRSVTLPDDSQRALRAVMMSLPERAM
jgi:hypothetical protein